MTYNVFGGTLNLALSIYLPLQLWYYDYRYQLNSHIGIVILAPFATALSYVL